MPTNHASLCQVLLLYASPSFSVLRGHLLCNNEGDMEIRRASSLSLSLASEPWTSSLSCSTWERVTADKHVTGKKKKKNTGLLYLLATGYRFLHPRFTRQFLEEHWHKQPEGVVKGERMDGGWRERSMDVHAHVWRRRTGGRQTRPTVSVQFPRHLKMNFSLESLCSALTRWWVPVGLKEEGRCMKLHDE